MARLLRPRVGLQAVAAPPDSEPAWHSSEEAAPAQLHCLPRRAQELVALG